MIIRPVGTELFHVDGRTNTTQLILTIRNFANALKNWWNAKKYGQNHLKNANLNI